MSRIVIVDSREPGWIAKNIRMVLKSVPVVVRKLDEGDIKLEGTNPKVLVERKDIVDFVQSMTSERLTMQMQLMSRECIKNGTIGILGIHGGIEKLSHTSVAWKEVLGAVASVAVRYGFQVVWIEDPIQWVYVISKMFEKIIQGKYGIPWARPYRRIDKRLQAVVLLLGVSPSLARAILTHFGSIEAILSAQEEEFVKVPGIGEKKARKLWELLHTWK